MTPELLLTYVLACPTPTIIVGVILAATYSWWLRRKGEPPPVKPVPLNRVPPQRRALTAPPGQPIKHQETE